MEKNSLKGDFQLVKTRSDAVSPYFHHIETTNQNKFLKKQNACSKPLWKIHVPLKCPIIGACLSLEESKKLLRKLGCKVRRLTPYQIHKTIMEHLGGENSVSIKIDKYLRHKYQQSIPVLSALEPEQFMEKWRDLFREGRIEDIFYVAVTRNDLSEAHLKEIFCEIHILSHANLDEVMKARQNLALQIQANHKLARELNQKKKQSKELKQENSYLKASLRNLKNKAQQNSDKSSDADVSKEKIIKNLEAEKIDLEKKIKEMESRNREDTVLLEKKNEHLRQEISDLKRVGQQLADEMRSLIAQFSSVIHCKEHCNKECSKFRLCARRILIVGGVTRIKHLYKHLIESVGGEFDYHDGYMKNGKQNLEVRVRRSDLIICPVDCNSHGAALNVKKLCQKYNKTVRMIPSSSLSAISNTLFEEAELYG